MDYTFSEYFKYRVQLRGFELEQIEEILRYGTERYVDTMTQHVVVVGRHDARLVLIPYEQMGEIIAPLTIHATTRQQINFRLKSGRFTYVETSDALFSR